MTAYIITPEQHAQIVDALECSTPVAEFDDAQSEATAQIEHNTALAMLKGARPGGAVCINGSLHKPAPKVVLWRME